MKKTAKIAAGSTIGLALVIAGGLALAVPAQAVAPTPSPTVASVDQVDAPDAGSTQADVADAKTGTEAPEGAVTESTASESASDDVNGVNVQDGPQN